ncbi:MAG TPA: hypothetical protein VLW17_12895 [Thermoanaerobaculaceae bacterium]|nr:hypothetical protein [Thermoanaerobaculaceae bacterium]
MFRSSSALALAALLASAPGARVSAALPLVDPDALFAAENWPAVEKAYVEIARVNPDDAMAFFRVAIARLHLGKPAAAVTDLMHAEALGWPAPQTAFRLACAYALLGRRELALDQLERANRAGFSRVQLLRDEPELDAVRKEARFAAALEGADRNLRPCAYDPAYAQFDFWVGEWDVRPAGAPESTPPASSVISKVLDGCVVLESWSGQDRGQSFNIFDKTEGRWHQTWVDTTGGLHEYWGRREGDSMAFTGEVAESPGQPRFPTRMTFTRQGPDRVRQFSETSKDGGRTWVPNYDLIYTRRAPAAR